MTLATGGYDLRPGDLAFMDHWIGSGWPVGIVVARSRLYDDNVMGHKTLLLVMWSAGVTLGGLDMRHLEWMNAQHLRGWT